MGLYLRAKFEASSIILTSFSRTPKKPTQLGLNEVCKYVPVEP